MKLAITEILQTKLKIQNHLETRYTWTLYLLEFVVYSFNMQRGKLVQSLFN